MSRKLAKSTYMGNENLPTSSAEFEWTPEMVEEVDKCRRFILQFSKHFTIVDLEKGKVPIKLRDYQKRILKTLHKNRFVSVLSSRQSGKTTLMTIYALWIACFTDDQRIMVIANKEKTAIQILKRIKLAYEFLPNYLKPGVESWGSTNVEFSNGSSIAISTTSADSARGDSCNVAIIDEMAFIPDNLIDEFWKSVFPIISSSKTSKVFVVSTPNGTGNKFHEIYTRAERGENNWVAERVDWWEVPGRDEEWKNNMIKEIGSKEAFDQEFGNVFFEHGQKAIDQDLIEEYKKNARDPIWVGDRENYKIWSEPNEHGIYGIGVDVGEGIGRAYSVAQILNFEDLTKIDQCACFSTNDVEPFHWAKELVDIAKQWGNPPIAIERNNSGGQVIDALIHTHHYENVVSYTPSMGKQNEKITPRNGIFAHTNSKYNGMSNMRYWMNSLRAVQLWDIRTIQEFDTYVKGTNNVFKKSKSNGSIFDDRVEALIWGLFLLDPAIAEQYFHVEEFDERGKPLKILPLNPTPIAPSLKPSDRLLTRKDEEFYQGMNFNAPPALIGMHNTFDSEYNELIGEGWQEIDWDEINSGEHYKYKHGHNWF